MSLKIEVTVPTELVLEDKAPGYVNKALSAIGFRRQGEDEPRSERILRALLETHKAASAAVQEAVAEEAAASADQTAYETRAASAAYKAPVAEAPVAEAPKARRGRQPKAEPPAPTEPLAISTGEERVGPQDPPAEVAAQDKADEQAEREASKPADAPLTIDDLRQAVGEYVAAYGHPAMQEDGLKIIVPVLGPPTDGDTVWKAAKVPPERYADVINAIRKAIKTNPFERARVS